VPAPGSFNQAFGLDRMVTKTAPSAVSAGAYLQYAPATSEAGPRAADNRWSLRVATPPADTTAQIDLRVPEGAEVWIAGTKTGQTGPQRRFVSPPLTPGKTYTYEVRVTWKDGAREVNQSRELPVDAGARVSATFPAAAAE
jgi:uncharacterized protein (TIGR03000 family)